MATAPGQVYRCKICGNKVKVVEAGGGGVIFALKRNKL